MTVTRYRKQTEASELIRRSVMGVISHAPTPEPPKPAEPPRRGTTASGPDSPIKARVGEVTMPPVASPITPKALSALPTRALPTLPAILPSGLFATAEAIADILSISFYKQALITEATIMADQLKTVLVFC